MPDVLFSCPRCGKGLKLRDRSKLGRPGRCPACQHKFVLQEPEEVELELADAAPPVGTGARWVPDEAPPVIKQDAPAEMPMFGATPDPAPGGGDPPLPLVAAASASSSTSTLEQLRHRRRRQRRTSIIIGGVMGAGIGIAILAFVFARSAEPRAPVEKSKRQQSAEYEAEKTSLRDNLTLAREASPTDGEPIRLVGMPTGVGIVVHLRPAELWSDDLRVQEFRACFGEQIVTGVESWIREFCQFAPAEIEELLIGFVLPVRGQPPKLAAVVRTVEPQLRSQLLSKFPGELNDEHGHPVYVGQQQVYAFSDDRHTIAIAPNDFDAPAELANSLTSKQSAVTKDGILDLLEQTDRQRHITIVFEPLDIRLHQDFLVPERARPAADAVLDFFGEDIETVAWSIHHTDDQFFSQMLLRNQHVWTPTELQADIRKKLRRLPGEIYAAVRKMRPQNLGARMLIGRYPAMIKVFALQTLLAIGDGPEDRYVQLTTVLPERAGPNLVLASLLTWDESTRTDFSQDAPPQPSGPKLPDTVTERLKLPIEIDFEREPLEQAFQYIGRETSVKVEVDGEALEAAGMTRNVPQTHSLGSVPALQGIAAILARHEKDGLCIVIDESRKTMIVTTRTAAEQRGEKPFPVGN